MGGIAGSKTDGSGFGAGIQSTKLQNGVRGGKTPLI
jgi:hypothetical protein